MLQRRPHNLKFSDKVREIVKAIPKGETMTYKEVATLAGSPHACRAVGSVLRQNYSPEVPCHRVIRSDGGMGGYNRGGKYRKHELLKAEGAFKPSADVTDLRKFRRIKLRSVR
jgi:methylated-DNA-[protein]-cysteine S-methyltransferase